MTENDQQLLRHIAGCPWHSRCTVEADMLREASGYHVTHDHAVQFYEEPAFLYDRVSDFLEAGTRAGQPLIVIARGSTRAALDDRLSARGLDTDMLRRTRQLMLLDARQTLSRFMIGSMPNADFFRRTLGAVLEQAQEGFAADKVIAYGEMVDLLWRDGNPDGALRLEQLWNELASTYAFSLLCGYSMSNFASEADRARFEAICHEHGHVIPTEHYSTLLDRSQQLKEISVLQQRARALEAEIDRREALERRLRSAIERETEARQQAEAALQSRDDFLSAASHELRNPLNALHLQLVGLGRLVAHKPASLSTSAVLDRLAKADEQVMRISELVDTLLDLSRIRLGRLELNCEKLDLVTLAASVVDEFQQGNGAIRIELTSPAAIDGNWDRMRVEQILRNLLSNASKHGDGQPIRVVLGADEERVDIEVIDRGIGIPPEDLERIFERYERLAPDPRRDGFGLGLWITRQVVEAMGGAIGVQSKQGQGTTFSVRLPRFVQDTWDDDTLWATADRGTASSSTEVTAAPSS